MSNKLSAASSLPRCARTGRRHTGRSHRTRRDIDKRPASGQGHAGFHRGTQKGIVNENEFYSDHYLADIFDALRDVCGFAEETGVAPGIIVGRLQHDGVLPMKVGNKLKVRYQWQEKPDS